METDCEQQSQGKSSKPFKSLRSLVIFVLLLALLLGYYILSYEVSETWITRVGLYFPDIFTNISQTTVSNETSEEPLEHWSPPEPYYVAYPKKYIFIMNEPEKCQKENPFVVLIVPVAPSSKETRDAIRSTWGTERLVGDKVVSVLFLLGHHAPPESEALKEDLIKESETYHDLLQSDFWDSYYNLTIKTIVMLEWVNAYCQNATFVMKVDSDVFLNVKSLVNMLLSAPKENYMTGLVARSAMVLRNPNSKWYLPISVYAPPFYPPYALGLGYVFSVDLSKKLVEAAQIVKPVYIEDVFLGLCMKHLGIPLTDPQNGGLFNVFPVDYNRCRYSQLIATTTKSLSDLVAFWKDLQTPGPYC